MRYNWDMKITKCFNPALWKLWCCMYNAHRAYALLCKLHFLLLLYRTWFWRPLDLFTGIIAHLAFAAITVVLHICKQVMLQLNTSIHASRWRVSITCLFLPSILYFMNGQIQLAVFFYFLFFSIVILPPSIVLYLQWSNSTW